MPYVALSGLVKFPTASRARGLGTGRFDFGIESEVTWLARRFTPFAMIGYRFLGDPPGASLRNVIPASTGAQYRIAEWMHLGLLLDYRQAASAFIDEQLDLVPFTSFRAWTHWSLNAYASAGLADGSPDASVGVEMGYAF